VTLNLTEEDMNRFATSFLLLPLLALGCAQETRMGTGSTTTSPPTGSITITRSGSQPPQQGPADYFTGNVRVEPLFKANEPSRTSGGLVNFPAGARSAWHTHPLGQTLIVTAGVGRVQHWGGLVEEIRAGDVVWIPPGVKHWHGAAPTSAMSHIAIQEGQNGKVVDWLEKVSDEQYNMSPTKPKTSSADIKQPNVDARRLSPEDVRRVAPALEKYTQDRLYGEVWDRPGLSKRDRSIVTITAMIARGQTGALTYYFGQALDNGVKPSEISEIITHLAFYSGWGNAFGAVGAAKDVFAQRGIGPDQLPAASDELLTLDEAAESQRAAQVEKNFGSVAPGVVQYTTDALFRDLWLRPGLAPRDRSLVTVSALVANGQAAQITYHLNRAMDNGLTQSQASEAMTQLAFYAGWPNVFSALPVVKDVIESRSAPGK
jgi:4-carboxymuconolactone decarboxylase